MNRMHLCFICSIILFCGECWILYFSKYRNYGLFIFIKNILSRDVSTTECLDLDTNVVTIASNLGQLGNTIWEYLSLLAITHLCKRFNVTLYVTSDIKKTIGSIFQEVNNLSELPRLDWNCKYIEKTWNFNESLNDCAVFKGETKILLYLASYSARYEDVIKYGIDNILEELRFRDSYRTSAYNTLNQISKRFKMNYNNVTFVGMHYRGTDYIYLMHDSYHNTFKGPPDSDYYLKGMNYFKTKFTNVIFILLTVDFEWLKTNLPVLKTAENNLVVNPGERDAIQDLALLAHCNHSIISYGTYGVTAALFANGITFVYDMHIPLDRDATMMAVGMAHILPNWNVME